MPRTDKQDEPKSQVDKFRDAARELKTDQSDTAFEAVVNKIAHAPKLTNEQIKELVRRKREQTKR
ncbi:gas vesicle protein [Mesorhizobium sangaii]|uniref:Gas vesicle protein n=2 Tax=Mesorhizobium sangaii TaxID=505389 RepID=A0A841PIE4_9HYPH|nr:gas vesicle protein [Mesorhizobium sangaii]